MDFDHKAFNDMLTKIFSLAKGVDNEDLYNISISVARLAASIMAEYAMWHVEDHPEHGEECARGFIKEGSRGFEELATQICEEIASVRDLANPFCEITTNERTANEILTELQKES